MGNQQEIILYSCGSKYNGEVRNNNPHGKGILYIHKNSPAFNPKLSVDNEGLSSIEGEFEDGKLKKCIIHTKNGFTFESSVSEKSTFEGDARLTDNDKVRYEGTFVNGKLTKGKIESRQTNDQSDIAYVCETEGQFIGTSIINGNGTFYNITEKYLATGQFHKGKISKGLFIYQNGDQYQGEYSQGLPYGQGVYKTLNFQEPDAGAHKKSLIEVKYVQQLLETCQKTQNQDFLYNGNFQNGNPNGKGQITFGNGHKYKGRCKDGRIHGYGQYVFSDGTVYKGNFYCGSMNGDCTIEFNQKSKINQGKQKHELLQKYEGQVSEGVFHGLGILYYANGVIFKGYFLQGAKNGPGVLIYCQNKFKCLYIMNRLIGQLKMITDQ